MKSDCIYSSHLGHKLNSSMRVLKTLLQNREQKKGSGKISLLPALEFHGAQHQWLCEG